MKIKREKFKAAADTARENQRLKNEIKNTVEGETIQKIIKK